MQHELLNRARFRVYQQHRIWKVNAVIYIGITSEELKAQDAEKLLNVVCNLKHMDGRKPETISVIVESPAKSCPEILRQFCTACLPQENYE